MSAKDTSASLTDSVVAVRIAVTAEESREEKIAQSGQNSQPALCGAIP